MFEKYRTSHPWIKGSSEIPVPFLNCSGDIMEKWGGKTTRTKGWGDVPQKAVFQTCCSHALMRSLHCSCLCKTSTNLDSLTVHHEWRRDCEASPLPEGLLATSGYWRRDVIFFSTVSCSSSFPHSSTLPTPHSWERNCN